MCKVQVVDDAKVSCIYIFAALTTDHLLLPTFCRVMSWS